MYRTAKKQTKITVSARKARIFVLLDPSRSLLSTESSAVVCFLKTAEPGY
jgi:hypothetical protein